MLEMSVSLRGIKDLTHVPDAAQIHSVAMALKILPRLPPFALGHTLVDFEDLALEVCECLSFIANSILVVDDLGSSRRNGKGTESFLGIDADNLGCISCLSGVV